MHARTRDAVLLVLLVVPAGYAQTPADQPAEPSGSGRIVSTLVIGTAASVAADIDAQSHPLLDGPPATPEASLAPDELDRLVADLGSRNYQTRLEATRTLAGLSFAAIDGLTGAYASSDDLEVRLRLREIVERRFIWDHLLRRHGFLGIEMSRPMRTPDIRVPMAPGAGAVHVRRVLPGGAAETAGLRADDLILELNGEPIPFSLELLDFGQQVSSAGAGGILRLGIIRNGTRLDLQVPLNHRPREHYWSPGYWDRLGAASRGFERYWRTHFLAPSSDVPSSEQPAREQTKP